MKNTPFLLAATLILVAIISFSPFAKSLTGRWVITYSNGTQTLLQVHDNGTFRVEIPAEHYVVGGKFKYGQDMLKISDTSCNAAYWGSYKLTFHGNDSIFAEVIEDSCGPRRSSLDKQMLVRKK